MNKNYMKEIETENNNKPHKAAIVARPIDFDEELHKLELSILTGMDALKAVSPEKFQEGSESMNQIRFIAVRYLDRLQEERILDAKTEKELKKVEEKVDSEIETYKGIVKAKRAEFINKRKAETAARIHEKISEMEKIK